MKKVILTKEALRTVLDDILDSNFTSSTLGDENPPVTPIEPPLQEAFEDFGSGYEQEKPKSVRIHLDPKLRGKARDNVPGRYSMRVKSAGTSIPWEMKPGQSLTDISKELKVPAKALAKLNNLEQDEVVASTTPITIPPMTLAQLGQMLSVSPAETRRKIAIAFDKVSMASSDHGATPELVALMDDLRDTAVFEFQQALEPHLPLIGKLIRAYIRALENTGNLDSSDLETLKNPSSYGAILSLEGFQKIGIVQEKLYQWLTFQSPTGKTLLKKASKSDPEGVRIIDAAQAFLAAGGDLETGDVEPEDLEIQPAARRWLDQREYWDWVRNSAAAIGHYGVDAKKGLKYNPEGNTGVGQW